MNISTIVRCIVVVLPATLTSSVLLAQQVPSIPWIEALGEALRRGQPLVEPAGVKAVELTKPAGTEKKAVTWLNNLAEGQRKARADGKPLLIRAGADWCAICRLQQQQIERPEVQAALANWTCVYVDVDRSEEDAQRLNITAVPVLTIRTSAGKNVALHEGALSTEELIAWLKKHRKAASVAPAALLLGLGEPSAADVVKLAGQLADRDPTIRQASIRRLLLYPGAARQEVVGQFADGSLGVRLAALELLQEWKAPLDDIDPWRPETLTDERLAALRKWSELPTLPVPKKPGEISDAQRKEAKREIDRMLGGTDQEAAAIREQLARHGSALSDEVYQRLARATTDRERERLLTLRYRLVADDTLVLRWPDGLTRLAATDSRQRQKAAEELAELAGTPELELLLELFSDSDPLVRELSLLGLQRIGGKKATAALVRLLADPEPNVRAAVLKQLTESPSPELAPQVAEYMKGEKDADLLVHAIRFMRAAGGADATRSLLAVLEHESWQVRAEAAEAIGSIDIDSTMGMVGGMGGMTGGMMGRVSEGGLFQLQTNTAITDSTVDTSEPTHRHNAPAGETPSDESLAEQVQAAMIKLLDDEDAFVVSRAIEGLYSIDSADAVEPLVRVAKKHPKLATQIVTMLAGGSAMRAKALPHLRDFAQHEDPAIRAAAVEGLSEVSPDDIDKTLLAGLEDPDATVRIATASITFDLLEEHRSTAMEQLLEVEPTFELDGNYPLSFDEPVVVRESTTARLMRMLGNAMRGAETPESQADDDGDDVPPGVLLPGSAPIPPTPALPPEDLPAPVLPQESSDASATIEPLRAVPPVAVPAPPVESPPSIAVRSGDIEVSEEPYDGPFPVVLPRTIPAPLQPGSSQVSKPKLWNGPVEKKEDLPPGEAWDKWLKDYHVGEARPEWAEIAIGPLEKMLQAEDVRERLAAAQTLIPLGKAELALPVLLDPKNAHPEQFAKASAILPWLSWQQRLEIFRQLRRLAADTSQVRELIYRMIEVPDVRAADELWSMLTDDKNAAELVSIVESGLMTAYTGEDYFWEPDVGSHQQQALIKAAETKANDGTEWQRVVAMALLVSVDSETAVRVARKLDADDKLSEQLRLDAFRVMLVASPEDAQMQIALTAIGGDDTVRRQLALALLAGNSQRVAMLRENLHLDGAWAIGFNYSSGEPIIPKVPDGLKPEHVRPLLKDSDPLTAAYAGYLLAVMGEPDGLKPLLDYWRKPTTGELEDSEHIRCLVYRAIAALDDSSQIPALREIYDKMSPPYYYTSDFYWTIRTMTGQEIRKFREKIREEVGEDNLDF